MVKKSAEKKPKSINISGRTIKIVWHKVQPGEEVENWGIFHPDTATIDLIDWEEWPRVLYHEATHAALHYSGYSQLFKDEKEEEALVTALEYALSPIYRLR